MFSRRKPDISSDLVPEAATTALFHGRDVSLCDRFVQGGDATNTEGTLRVEASALERVSFAGCRFSSVLLKDVRLVGCDLANMETRALTLIRVELLNCRMTGFRSGEADCRDVLISEGDQRYAQFRYSKFRGAEFDSCNFAEADFQGSDLSGSIFRKCNLQSAEFSKVKLVDTDLRGSVVDGVRVTAPDLRGAVVDLTQAMTFIPLLGMRVE